MSGNVPMTVYLLLPPLALKARRSGTSALRLVDRAVTAHNEALEGRWYAACDVVCEDERKARRLAGDLVGERMHKRTLGKLTSLTLESNYL